MSIDWQNGAPDRSRTALPDSYKPRALRLAAAEPTVSAARPDDLARPDETGADDTGFRDAEPARLGLREVGPPVVDLSKLEAELGRKRLDEIADVVRALTYGEMMELAESMWSVRPDDSDLSENNLPATLYRWSKSRQV